MDQVLGNRLSSEDTCKVTLIKKVDKPQSQPVTWKKQLILLDRKNQLRYNYGIQQAVRDSNQSIGYITVMQPLHSLYMT